MSFISCIVVNVVYNKDSELKSNCFLWLPMTFYKSLLQVIRNPHHGVTHFTSFNHGLGALSAGSAERVEAELLAAKRQPLAFSRLPLGTWLQKKDFGT